MPDTRIFVVDGDESNIKLTHIEDLYILDKMFQLRSQTIVSELNSKSLENKVLVVFGGNSGIGKSICDVALNCGARVYSFSRSTTGTDISNISNVEMALHDVYEKEKRVDYIVNCAAILLKEPLNHMSYSDISEMINVNYLGMVNISLAAFKYLKETKGHLLHFTSSSYTLGRAFYSLYSSTKAAVVNFMQAISQEWEEFDIQVNCINPERTKTPLRERCFGKEPVETLLKPDDVALASLKTLLSKYTGQVIDVKKMS